MGSYSDSGAWGSMENFQFSFYLRSGGTLPYFAYFLLELFLLHAIVYLLIIVLFSFGFCM